MTTSNQDPSGRSTDSMSGNSGNGTTKQKIDEDIQDAKHELGSKAREEAESGQHRVADEADALSDAIDAAASNLDDNDREGLAHYARELSSNLSDAAGQLEGRSVDELANDAKRLARKNPAMFMLGSIAVGFGLSRFFAASTDRNHQHDNNATTDMPEHQPARDMTETYTTSTTALNGDGRGIL